MRVSNEHAASRGLGGLWLHPNPEPWDIERMCREIQATWPPEEFVERRSYQEPVSPRRRMFMRQRRER